jgi:nitrogen regulatory protein P-II 1
MLLAIIRPTKLQAVLDALKTVGVERMTVCDAHGYGRQKGQTETYRGVEYKINLLRKVVLEIVVNDDFVQRTVDTIEQVARTGSEGNIGDGKIFQIPVSKLELVRDVESLCQRLRAGDVRCVIVDLTLAGIDPGELAARLHADPGNDPELIAVGPHVHQARLDAARAAGWRVLTRGQLHAGQWVPTG